MVYRIQYDINSSLSPLFSKIKTLGDFIFTNNTIYIYTKENKISLLTSLKELLPPEDQIMVVEISTNNLFQQSDNVKSWVNKMWKQEEIKRIEDEQQDALLRYNKFLDLFEQELEKQLQNKKEVRHGEKEKGINKTQQRSVKEK